MEESESLLNQLYSLKTIKGINTFFVELATSQLNSNQRVKLVLKILERFASTDFYTIVYRCYKILEEHASFDDIEQVKLIAGQLPDLQGLRDYRDDFKIKLPILLAKKGQIQCLCRSKASFRTSYSEEDFRLVKQVSNEDYTLTFIVICVRCYKEWAITEDISYHFPTYHWSEI
ncbi:MAG: hypothetical protein R2822_24500 [Spirosomataceae bacterium]